MQQQRHFWRTCCEAAAFRVPFLGEDSLFLSHFKWFIYDCPYGRGIICSEVDSINKQKISNEGMTSASLP
jgi:hypothetical protein